VVPPGSGDGQSFLVLDGGKRRGKVGKKENTKTFGNLMLWRFYDSEVCRAGDLMERRELLLQTESLGIFMGKCLRCREGLTKRISIKKKIKELGVSNGRA